MHSNNRKTSHKSKRQHTILTSRKQRLSSQSTPNTRNTHDNNSLSSISPSIVPYYAQTKAKTPNLHRNTTTNAIFVLKPTDIANYTKQNTTQHSQQIKLIKKKLTAKAFEKVFNKPPSTDRRPRRLTLSSQLRSFRVAVLGAANQLGQPLSMLLKHNKTGLITSLALYDHLDTLPELSNDLSLVQSPFKNSPPVRIDTYWGHDELGIAMENADIVISALHHPRGFKVGQKEWYQENALIQLDVARHFAQHSPDALALVVSPRWVNSFVPLWAEALKRDNVHNPSKILGVTTLHQFRINSLLSNYFSRAISIPVIGGAYHSSLLPLFSTINGFGRNKHADEKNPIEITGDLRLSLFHRINYADFDIDSLQRQPDFPSALSQASSVVRFVESCLYGLSGNYVTNEIAYVESKISKDRFAIPFFSSELVLGPNGVESIKPTWDRCDEWERIRLMNVLPVLRSDIATGTNFVQSIYDPKNQGLHTPPHPSVMDNDSLYGYGAGTSARLQKGKNKGKNSQGQHSVGEDGIDNFPENDDDALMRDFESFKELVKAERNQELDDDLQFDKFKTKEGDENGLNEGEIDGKKGKKGKKDVENDENNENDSQDLDPLEYNTKSDVLYSQKYDPRLAALARGQLERLFGGDDDDGGGQNPVVDALDRLDDAYKGDFDDDQEGEEGQNDQNGNPSLNKRESRMMEKMYKKKYKALMKKQKQRELESNDDDDDNYDDSNLEDALHPRLGDDFDYAEGYDERKRYFNEDGSPTYNFKEKKKQKVQYAIGGKNDPLYTPPHDPEDSIPSEESTDEGILDSENDLVVNSDGEFSQNPRRETIRKFEDDLVTQLDKAVEIERKRFAEPIKREKEQGQRKRSQDEGRMKQRDVLDDEPQFDQDGKMVDNTTQSTYNPNKTQSNQGNYNSMLANSLVDQYKALDEDNGENMTVATNYKRPFQQKQATYAAYSPPSRSSRRRDLDQQYMSPINPDYNPNGTKH